MRTDPFGICLVNILPYLERPGLLTEFWNPRKTSAWFQAILEVNVLISKNWIADGSR